MNGVLRAGTHVRVDISFPLASGLTKLATLVEGIVNLGNGDVYPGDECSSLE